jgi:nucleoside-diphosphate-sugar epimerase
MRVLVTGAGGFIGTNVLQSLAGRSDVHVTALDLKFPHPIDADNITYVCENAADHSYDAYDVVVHLAATAGLRDSDDNPKHFMDNNVLVTQHVFESVRVNNPTCRIVYASSSSVYGDQGGNDDEVALQGQPNSIYGLTKRMCEDLASYYHSRHGIESVGLRFFTVYGPHDRDTMAMGRFAHALQHRKPIRINGDGQQSRDFTHVDDVVNVINHCIFHSVPEPVYNVGVGATTSLHGLIDEMCSLLDVEPVLIVYGDGHPADVRTTQSTVTKRCLDMPSVPAFTPLHYGLQKYLNMSNSNT